MPGSLGEGRGTCFLALTLSDLADRSSSGDSVGDSLTDSIAGSLGEGRGNRFLALTLSDLADRSSSGDSVGDSLTDSIAGSLGEGRGTCFLALTLSDLADRSSFTIVSSRGSEVMHILAQAQTSKAIIRRWESEIVRSTPI